ncbi:MAG: hypothetical protein ABSH26_05080 [Opitutaceae bacterium]|jgi:hypothetical protein
MPPTPKPTEPTPGQSGAGGKNAPAGKAPRTAPCDIQVDESRNLVTFRYFGHVTAASMKSVTERAGGILSRLRPGFTVLTDLSGLESMELDCAPDLTGMMDRFRAKGVGTVVRIIPDPSKDIGFNILAIVHYRRGVHVVTCETAAEAERILKP